MGYHMIQESEYISRRNEIHLTSSICNPMLTEAVMTAVKELKQTKCTRTDAWIKSVQYVHHEILLLRKKS